jgi:hypothetical protein
MNGPKERSLFLIDRFPLLMYANLHSAAAKMEIERFNDL